MLKIVNNILQPENCLIFSSIKDTVEVVGSFPMSSPVICTINGCDTKLSFYLIYSHTIEDGNVFTGIFTINRRILDYINNHPEKDYTLTFKVSNINIEGEQKFVVNYAAIVRQINALPDGYQLLLEEYTKLKAKVNDLLNNRYVHTQLNNTSTGVGMMPIAVDGYGNYKWDYPFIKEKEDIKNIANVLQDISKQLIVVNTRLTKLEDKVLDHLYSEYE